MTVFICISLVLFAVVADAINHSIRHWRTDKMSGPYKDFSHLMSIIQKISLFGAGGAFLDISRIHGFWSYFILLISLYPLCLLWDVFEENREFWYGLDEKIKISIGIPWLDRLLGFHN